MCLIHIFPLVWDVVELSMLGKKTKTKKQQGIVKTGLRDENPEVQTEDNFMAVCLDVLRDKAGLVLHKRFS